MKNKEELRRIKNDIRTFVVVLLIMLYAMDFLVLANIIVASAIITKIVNKIIEKVGA